MKLFNHRGRWSVVVGIVLFSLLLSACGSANTGSSTGSTSSSGSTTTSAANGKGCKKVGVLLPETASSARWDSEDKPALEADIAAAIPGAQVLYNNASGDADQQQTQAEADMSNGACILVLAPVDSQKSAAIVASAKVKGIPVISYDRLIYSNDLNYYVSFDNEAVGTLQGKYIVDHYKSYVSGGNNNVVMINGAQTDNNALLFKQGALSQLQPLFDSKALNLKYSTFTPNWDNPTAQTEMEGALTSNANNIQIAYVANDGMANNVIAALKAHKLNKKVLVTGQDATVAGIQNILTGDQAMTVYKAINLEAKAASDLAAALSNGTSTASLTNGQTVKVPITGGSAIPSVLETPVAVDKTNINQTVIKDGFVTKAQICKGIPAGTDGVC
jgi:D-xylose transport system substrate-binding protein